MHDLSTTEKFHWDPMETGEALALSHQECSVACFLSVELEDQIASEQNLLIEDSGWEGAASLACLLGGPV